MFERLPSKKRSVHVVEQLLSALAADKFSVGDRLPSEQKIADQTGVSRPSVREALGVLRFLGVLDTRAGDGTYIRRIPRNVRSDIPLAEKISSILDEGPDLREAIEARQELETVMIRLAAKRRTKADLEVMEGVIAQIVDSIERRDVASFSRSDRDFHRRVAKAAKNELLEAMYCSLIDSIDNTSWQTLVRMRLEEEGELEETQAMHLSLLEAIEQQDVAAGTERITHHFDRLSELLGSVTPPS